MFRTGWDKNAIALNIHAKNRLSHHHYDQLSVAMWAYDKFLLTDQGYGNTNAPLSIIRSSQNHNMVVMNDKSLPESPSGDGKILGGELNDIFDFTSYAIPFAPDAETQQRSVLFDRNQKLFIISDYIRPKNMTSKNDYAQNWFMLPDADMVIDENTSVIRSNFEDINVSVTPVSPEKFSLVNFGEGMFAPNSGSWFPVEKAVYHKQNVVGDVTYDVVVVPENIGERFNVSTVPMDTGLPKAAANAFYFDLINAKTNKLMTRSYYFHLNDLTQEGSYLIGNYETDATTMYVTEDVNGELESVFLMNATYLKDSNLVDKYVFKSLEQVPSIAFKAVGQALDVASSYLNLDANSNDSDLRNMTFYNYGRLNGILVDGSLKTAKESGKYMHFGDEPIVVGTEKPDKNNDNNSSATSSNGPAHAGGSKIGPGPGTVVISPGTPSVEPPDITPGITTDNERDIPANIAAELENHWAEEEISEMYRMGIVNGSTSSLHLSEMVTRAELVALVVRALELTSEGSQTPFSDVLPQDWYAEFIAAASENEIIEGADGTFRPNDSITREEMCKIIMSVYRLKGKESSPDASGRVFADNDEISDWAKEYVYGAEAMGLINGMEDGTFGPKSPTLREQAFVILWRLMNN